MKALAAKVTRGLNIGSSTIAADNSGAKIIRITGIKRGKGRKGRQFSCGVGDMVKVSVKKGLKDMTSQLFWAVIIRQRKEYRRKTGDRIAFADNAVVLLKDEDGNPKGTMIKGPIAKEAADRWPFVARIANIIV
jgi:large subunit ribosomal protein L14